MKEAIGNSVVFGIVITFMAIIIVILASSTAYSKAFKVRNRIIEMIEYNEGYADGIKPLEELETEINDELSEYGYRLNTSIINDCPVNRGQGVLVSSNSKYNYCVYKFDSGDASINGRGIYYGVLTYMYFEIPMVENLKIGIYSETKTLYDLSNF